MMGVSPNSSVDSSCFCARRCGSQPAMARSQEREGALGGGGGRSHDSRTLRDFGLSCSTSCVTAARLPRAASVCIDASGGSSNGATPAKVSMPQQSISTRTVKNRGSPSNHGAPSELAGARCWRWSRGFWRGVGSRVSHTPGVPRVGALHGAGALSLRLGERHHRGRLEKTALIYLK